MNNRDAHIAGIEEERGEQEEHDEPDEEDEEEEEEEVEEEERQGKEERDDEGEDNVGEEQEGEEQGVGVSVGAAEEEEEEDDEKESGHDLVVVDGDGDGRKEDRSEDHPVMEGGTRDTGLIVEEERGQPVAGPGTGKKRGIETVGSREEENEGEDEEGEDEEDEEEEEEERAEMSPGVLSEAGRGARRSAKALAAAASMHELSSELFPLLVERLPEVLGQDPNFDPPGEPLCITKLTFFKRKVVE